MLWEMFSWHILGPLIPVNHCLNSIDYLSIVANHVHPFMATMYSSSNGYFQHDNSPCHNAKVISNWFHEHDNEFNVLQWPSTGSESDYANYVLYVQYQNYECHRLLHCYVISFRVL